MLKRDTNARFENVGFAFFSRYHFTSGKLDAAMSKEQHAAIMTRQRDAPVEVARDEERRRTFWLFQDEFYWEDEGYDELEVKALILERETQKNRRVQRAVALMQQTEAMDAPARAPIPDEVKVFVWNRDGGRCVKCGSNQRLEFDHVIPVALGGADAARNLQLLCETCNRSKGAAIA
ncbi:MAG TPA: HNH endonuclease signature motif containing protein [Dehalococcoidia bacterium]|nr:HNH endonuclease signature motif containing protein [Dehalococcoidia bacterium]